MNEYTHTVEGLKSYIETLEGRTELLFHEMKILEYALETLQSNERGVCGRDSSDYAYQMQITHILKALKRVVKELTDNGNTHTGVTWALRVLQEAETALP